MGPCPRFHEDGAESLRALGALQAVTLNQGLITSLDPEPVREAVACGCPMPLQGIQGPTWCVPPFLQAQSRGCCREAVEQQGGD